MIDGYAGMILFPLGHDVFSGLGPDGLSIFYVSCIVSQLVYSCGGSVFKGGIGSEMVGFFFLSDLRRYQIPKKQIPLSVSRPPITNILTCSRSRSFHSFTKWLSQFLTGLVRTTPKVS